MSYEITKKLKKSHKLFKKLSTYTKANKTSIETIPYLELGVDQ